jgi:predicted NUDIX family phosphoesterase
MKPPVLCITGSVIPSITSIGDIKERDLHFLNRELVDDKEDLTVGELLPQILPSIIVEVGDKFLSYSRKGGESRLHGSRSITLGGHVDITDYEYNLRDTIIAAANRELHEELGVKHYFEFKDFTHFIYLPENDVSKVHFALVTKVYFNDEGSFGLDEEIHNPEYLTKEQLLKDIDLYELWSQHIIKEIL